MRAVEEKSGRPEIRSPHDGTRRLVAVGFRGPCDSCEGDGEVLAWAGGRIFFVRCDCNGTGRRNEWALDAKRLAL